ncbi:hypothetical protein [Burkholderia sp. BCC1977]|uniref:hypothetical protein n=1 Tax=Burkholderia sp. BCC1977 TaxID=2817440 RepID=UPI002ABE2544|nr:hypothetical protein [Burkholderia sp. BCC1977]
MQHGTAALRPFDAFVPWPYPLTFLLLDCRNVRPNRLESMVLALTWTAPAQAFVAVITGTMLPIASVILVAVLARGVRRRRIRRRAAPDNARLRRPPAGEWPFGRLFSSTRPDYLGQQQFDASGRRRNVGGFMPSAAAGQRRPPASVRSRR